MAEELPLSTSPRPYRLTVDDFLRLDNAGAFEGLGKTELIRGEVLFLNAQHRPHARMKIEMYDALRAGLLALGSTLRPFVEATVAMPPHNAPEPDLILTSEPYGEGPIPLASVQMLIEIADSTQRHDLGTKADVYAENGVPEYWAVDLKAGVLHQMWSPSGEGYAQRREVALGGPIEAATIGGLGFVVPGVG
jgi:Uma2 family endonuclease